MRLQRRTTIAMSMLLMAGCASISPSEIIYGRKLPLYDYVAGENSANISFSASKEFETERGVPMSGEPLFCNSHGVFKISKDSHKDQSASVPAGNEIAVTSVISWNNAGWQKTCWPFVSFIPEGNQSYTVVNEKIGGKGISALWTGVAFQSCQVSIYMKTESGFKKVETKDATYSGCTGKQ